MKKQWVFFSGIFLLPVGLILSYAVVYLFSILSQYAGISVSINWVALVLLSISPCILMFLVNCYFYLFEGIRQFNPFISDGRPAGISKEKWKAMNPKIPNRYLTADISVGTIGKSEKDNKFITIPIIEDLKKGNANIVGIFGGSGAKKTTTLLTSITLATEQKCNSDIPSIFLYDIKPDIYDRIPDVYEKVNIVSFSENKNDLYYGWDMYSGITPSSTDDEIIRHMRMLSSCLIYNRDAIERGAYFYDNARNILTAYLYGTFKYLGLDFIDSITKLTSVSLQQNIEQLLELKDPKLKSMLGIYQGKEGESFDDIQTTLTTSLYVFSLDGVRWALKGNTRKAKPEDLVNGRHIIVCLPDAQLQLLAPLMSAQAEMVLQFVLGLPDRVGRAEEKPIWIILDELQSLPMIPSLIRAVSLMRSKKCSCWYISQSVDALTQRYGEKGINSLFENTSQLIILSAMAENTLKLCQNTCGNYKETMYSNSVSGFGSGNYSNSTSEQYRPIYDYEDIRALRSQNAFLALTSDGWFRGTKYTIRDDNKLLKRSEYYRFQNNSFFNS